MGDPKRSAEQGRGRASRLGEPAERSEPGRVESGPGRSGQQRRVKHESRAEREVRAEDKAVASKRESEKQAEAEPACAG